MDMYIYIPVEMISYETYIELTARAIKNSNIFSVNYSKLSGLYTLRVELAFVPIRRDVD